MVLANKQVSVTEKTLEAVCDWNLLWIHGRQRDRLSLSWETFNAIVDYIYYFLLLSNSEEDKIKFTV